MYIYILKLRSNKYYIGKSNNVYRRYKQHCMGKGSIWTTKYKPVKIIEKIKLNNNYEEEMYTLKYMNKFGIDNVRGGSFCKIKITDDEKKLINRLINSMYNRCYLCNKSGHFVNDCPNVITTNFEHIENSESSESLVSESYTKLLNDKKDSICCIIL